MTLNVIKNVWCKLTNKPCIRVDLENCYYCPEYDWLKAAQLRIRTKDKNANDKTIQKGSD